MSGGPAVSSFGAELAEVGVTADSPWDLVNRRSAYPTAIPVLVAWLDKIDQTPNLSRPIREKFREGVVRSLAVKEARHSGVAAVLLREFRRPNASIDARWAVANSLAVVADASVFDELVELAADKRYGRSREMLMDALARADKLRAPSVLVELLEDDDVSGHAVVALARVGGPLEADAIEPFLEHPKAWIRREATKALKVMKR